MSSNTPATKRSLDERLLPEKKENRPYKMRRYGLSEIVRAFKSFSAWQINKTSRSTGLAVWHRNYYEHIL